ncbi:hypothetical protein C7M84_003315 [Penaeus vannamei]|uniref:Uncharacterized protein n=1 Tax=Penaeus vannamei TaxID=6689 RepID=A0A3R7MB68_PENVA|nr:hypothetical protein C7M84_003315 [Penaeus vannamei]
MISTFFPSSARPVGDFDAFQCLCSPSIQVHFPHAHLSLPHCAHSPFPCAIPSPFPAAHLLPSPLPLAIHPTPSTWRPIYPPHISPPPTHCPPPSPCRPASTPFPAPNLHTPFPAPSTLPPSPAAHPPPSSPAAHPSSLAPAPLSLPPPCRPSASLPFPLPPKPLPPPPSPCRPSTLPPRPSPCPSTLTPPPAAHFTLLLPPPPPIYPPPPPLPPIHFTPFPLPHPLLRPSILRERPTHPPGRLIVRRIVSGVRGAAASHRAGNRAPLTPRPEPQRRRPLVSVRFPATTITHLSARTHESFPADFGALWSALNGQQVLVKYVSCHRTLPVTRRPDRTGTELKGEARQTTYLVGFPLLFSSTSWDSFVGMFRRVVSWGCFLGSFSGG